MSQSDESDFISQIHRIVDQARKGVAADGRKGYESVKMSANDVISSPLPVKKKFEVSDVETDKSITAQSSTDSVSVCTRLCIYFHMLFIVYSNSY